MSDQEFVRLLESLLKPDTDLVREATATLNRQYYTSPASLTALVRISTTAGNPQLQQLAAVEARKLVAKHWQALPDDQKRQARQELLQAALSEDNKLVRHSIARIVASIAKIDFEDGQWTELPSLMKQAASSTSVRHREVGVYVIYTIIETTGGDFFLEKIEELFPILSKTLQDPESSEVRINTLLTLSNIAMFLDPDDEDAPIASFQQCVPYMVRVLKQTIDDEDEGAAMQAFEVFQTLLGCDSALLQLHFKDLMMFMLEVGSNTDLEDEYRSQALAFLMQGVRYRKLRVQALRIGEELTIKSLQIVTELGKLITDEEEITPARSALGLLDVLASSLPPSQVVVPLLKAIGPYIVNQNPDYRRAGILALGMCVEGAPDFIATQLKEILPVVLQLLQDPDIRVRAAALNAVARLSDDLAEDVGKEHAKLIPAMVRNFDLASNSLPTSKGEDHEEELGIIRGSCHAIDSLIEGLPKESAALYLNELVPRLKSLFGSDDIKTKSASIAAVGSLAAAAEEAFLPVFQPIMQELGQYVTIKENQEQLDLRGIVCDALGKIASAVGPEAFQPYVQPLMQASEEALHLDHPRLRECSYILWSTLAKVYKENFSDYLSGVVKGLNDCLAQDESPLEVELGEHAADLLGQEITIGGKKIKVAAATNDDEDDDFEDIDDNDLEELGAVSAVAMEKEVAVEVVGDILSETRSKFVPYLDTTIQTVLGLCDHSYEGVRKSAVVALCRAYEMLWEMAETEGMAKWQPGIPLQVEPPADLRKFGGLVMQSILKTWRDEMDMPTVTDINRSLCTVIKDCGPAILISDSGTVVPEVTNQLIAIITKKHTCQQDLGDEGETEEELHESSEYDWLLVDTAIDTVIALSAALGPSFSELWKIFEKPLIRYASSHDATERSSAVGAIAECIGNMGVAASPYTAQLMKIIVHRLSDEDADVKANAVYAAGLLSEMSTNEREVLSNYAAILGKLQPLLDGDTPGRLLDNAAGCVARMIMKHPDRVPLDEVLPALVALLPAKEDYEENRPTMRCIVQLYRTKNPLIQQLTPQIAPAIQKVLGPPEDQLDEETRSQLMQLVEYLRQKA